MIGIHTVRHPGFGGRAADRATAPVTRRLLAWQMALACLIGLAALIATPNPLRSQEADAGANTAPPNPVPRPAQVEAAIPLDPALLTLDALDDPFANDPIGAQEQDGEQTAPAVQTGFEIVPPDPDAAGVPIRLTATLNEGGRVLDSDLAWTVYALGDQEVTDDDIVLTAQGGPLDSALPPGSYIVHVSYGMATLTRPITIAANGYEDMFALNAGGIALRGAVGAEDFPSSDLVTFQVYPEAASDDAEPRAIVRDVDERAVLVVPAGRYTIVSRYGDVNAVVRAEIDVEPGQLTEAVMFHQAAQITLKLVNEPNGEALPNTAWSILNAGGDVIREFVGAFPTMVLASGDYTIIARHDGQVFSREFTVVTGVNRDEELVAQ